MKARPYMRRDSSVVNQKIERPHPRAFQSYRTSVEARRSNNLKLQNILLFLIHPQNIMVQKFEK